jgi:hypothetical protein
VNQRSRFNLLMDDDRNFGTSPFGTFGLETFQNFESNFRLDGLRLFHRNKSMVIFDPYTYPFIALILTVGT